MNQGRLLFPVLAAALAMGCNSEEQLQRVEQEVGDLKLEVFKLRQQVEDGNKRAETEFQASAESRNLDRRFQADLQESLRQVQDAARVLNNRLNSLPKNTGRGQVESSSSTAVAGGEDERVFNAAVLDYNRGNYPLAVEGLELFLKTYPQSGKRPDALFFLGLSQFNQGVFDKAQAAFERVIKEHAASSQFLPAKLKRAQSLLKQGLKPAAIKGFRELMDGFSGSTEARIAQQELSDLGI